MANYLVGTSALVLFSVAVPATFSVHADADNSDTVNISTSDPSVSTIEEELQAGQTISYNNWTGTIYAVAESGTQSIGITGFSQTEAASVVKS